MRIFNQRLIAAAVMSLIPAGHAIAVPVYTSITDMGIVRSAVPADVNDLGQITGQFQPTAGTSRAFRWTEAGGVQNLGALVPVASSSGEAINNSGQVAGYSGAGGPTHAFRWTENGGMQDLGTLGGSSSYAWGISDSGAVTGEANTATGQSHAFRWTESGGMQDLGTLSGSISTARAINDAGQVAGYSLSASGQVRAFRWTENGGMQDLGALGGGPNGISFAFAINESGAVVGNSVASAGPTHAFRWTESGGMEDMGSVGGPSEQSVAEDINDDGLAVGYSIGSSGTLATLWGADNSIFDLNDLLPSGASGWDLRQANGINNFGDVIGIGFLNGEQRAFLMTAARAQTSVPLPGTAVLLLPGLVSPGGRRCAIRLRTRSRLTELTSLRPRQIPGGQIPVRPVTAPLRRHPGCLGPLRAEHAYDL